jgi:hypothetical protein
LEPVVVFVIGQFPRPPTDEFEHRIPSHEE